MGMQLMLVVLAGKAHGCFREERTRGGYLRERTGRVRVPFGLRLSLVLIPWNGCT